jgi:hypothetical protein
MPSNAGPETDRSEPFIGSWTLSSFELRLKSGEIRTPFGEHPVGRILYQRSGQMSAQLMHSTPAAFGNPDPLQASPEEVNRAWHEYTGYWGTFRVDPVAPVVTHRVEGSSFPNWVGQNQIRSFRFEGDQLILQANSPDWTATLRWRRID